MTDTAEAKARLAWLVLSNHGFTCTECRVARDRPQDAVPDCPAEWESYRVWKRLWVEAGCPPVTPAEVSA